jgi:hypothetical protein
MTKWEVKYLQELINNNKFDYTYYSYIRLNEREIPETSVEKTIKYGNIIEFHYKDGDARVLLRGRSNVDGYSICVVLSLSKKQIITIYKNEFMDNHDTLHNEIYNNKIDIMKYIKVS